MVTFVSQKNNRYPDIVETATFVKKHSCCFSCVFPLQYFLFRRFLSFFKHYIRFLAVFSAYFSFLCSLLSCVITGIILKTFSSSFVVLFYFILPPFPPLPSFCRLLLIFFSFLFAFFPFLFQSYFFPHTLFPVASPFCSLPCT